MKIARIDDNGTDTYGFVSKDSIATRGEIVRCTGIPLPPKITDFVFDGWLEEVLNRKADLPYGKKLRDVRLLAPIPDPPKIICLAFNYPDHAGEQGLKAPKNPVPVIKPRTALCGSGSQIELADPVRDLDYEGEMALVIGRRCKKIGADEAGEAIFGYMVLNDVSARDLQFKDVQFTRAKGFDTFAPCGPWITTADEVGSPDNLWIKTTVNGQIRQDSSTSMMAVKPHDIVSKLSATMTLEAGDIISTGTPAGVALNSKKFGYLRGGDVVKIEIEKLGSITNTVSDVRTGAS